MNPTLLLIASLLLLMIVGLIVLLLWSLANLFKRREEEDPEQMAKAQNRLDFLRQYSIQMESMKNQHMIADDEYEAEMQFINASLDEIEEKQ